MVPGRHPIPLGFASCNVVGLPMSLTEVPLKREEHSMRRSFVFAEQQSQGLNVLAEFRKTYLAPESRPEPKGNFMEPTEPTIDFQGLTDI